MVVAAESLLEEEEEDLDSESGFGFQVRQPMIGIQLSVSLSRENGARIRFYFFKKIILYFFSKQKRMGRQFTESGDPGGGRGGGGTGAQSARELVSGECLRISISRKKKYFDFPSFSAFSFFDLLCLRGTCGQFSRLFGTGGNLEHFFPFPFFLLSSLLLFTFSLSHCSFLHPSVFD